MLHKKMNLELHHITGLTSSYIFSKVEYLQRHLLADSSHIYTVLQYMYWLDSSIFKVN